MIKHWMITGTLEPDAVFEPREACGVAKPHEPLSATGWTSASLNDMFRGEHDICAECRTFVERHYFFASGSLPIR